MEDPFTVGTGMTEGLLGIPQFVLSCQNRDTDVRKEMKPNETGSENTLSSKTRQRTESGEVGRHCVNP